MKRAILFAHILIISILISSCEMGYFTELFTRPTPTSTPTQTPTIIPSPTPTNTPTSTPKPTATPDPVEQADAAYAELLKRVKEADPNLDFTELRMVFSQTTHYDPYAFDTAEMEEAMHSAYNNNDFELAIEMADQMLEKNFLLPEPHIVALAAYDELGDTENTNFHFYVLDGLIDSILESGDGRSPETAFVVIHIQEEYMILGVLGIEIGSQGVDEKNGIMVDLFIGTDQETNEEVTIYFDISIPFNWLTGSLGQ